MLSCLEDKFWNTVNLASIAGLDERQCQEVGSAFRSNPSSFPLGLVPVANELLANFNKTAVFKAFEDMEENNWLAPIDTDESTILPTNSLPLSSAQTVASALDERINRGAPTLIRTPSQYNSFSFLNNLFMTHPNQNIVVVTESAIGQNTASLGIQLAKKFRELGHATTWMNNEESARSRRIRICDMKNLTLNSMKIWAADIFVCLDTVEFVNRRFGGEGAPYSHWDLFGTYGTSLKHGCRIIGLLQTKYSQRKNLIKVWSIFGIDELSINSNNEISDFPKVRFVSRSKADSLNIKIPQDSSLADQKRLLFWTNVARNRFIAKQAKALFENVGDTAKRLAESTPMPFHRIGIVVENEPHAQEMKTALGKASSQIPVLTFADIRGMGDNLPDALVRADGGTGLLPIENLCTPLTVIDVKDEGTWLARKFLKMRKREYALHWLLGHKPYLAKFKEALSPKRG